MISGCIYHKLESLLPPLVPTHNDFPTLFHISACSIMRDEDTARCLLPVTPAILFKPLLQAAIWNNFYKMDRRLKLVPGSLVQLILHWPHESFVLRELLPPLPPRNLNRLSHFNSSLDIIERELQTFYEEIIDVLLPEVIRTRTVMASTDEWKFSQVKKIDISGYRTMSRTVYLSDDPTPYNYLHKLLASLEAAVNPNSSGIVCDNHKIELICDVIIDASLQKGLNVLGAIAYINCQHGAKFSVTFKKVRIEPDDLLPLQNNQIVSLLDLLFKNGTEFLDLIMNEVDDEMATCFNPQLQGLYISRSKITHLDFLKNMSNLQQLYVVNVMLRNKLIPLCCLPRGLTCLMLCGCDLNGEDMKVLGQSHHTKTIVQLDLSNNDFARPIDASGLIELCQALVSVQILGIEYCGLNLLTSDIVGLLFQSLATLPKLSLLDLKHNKLASMILCTQIKVLRTCMSLRCVCLTISSDLYATDDDFNIIQNRIRDVQSKVDSEINCSRETVVNVIWEKDWYYEDWLHSIQMIM